MKKVLFIPGPSEVENDVLLELSKPVIPHYGSEWHVFFNRTCDTVRKIFRTKGYVTILPKIKKICGCSMRALLKKFSLIELIVK